MHTYESISRCHDNHANFDAHTMLILVITLHCHTMIANSRDTTRLICEIMRHRLTVLPLSLLSAPGQRSHDGVHFVWDNSFVYCVYLPFTLLSRSITRLDVSANSITWLGAQHLVDGLRSLASTGGGVLETLVMDENPLGQAGVVTFLKVGVVWVDGWPGSSTDGNEVPWRLDWRGLDG